MERNTILRSIEICRRLQAFQPQSSPYLLRNDPFRIPSHFATSLRYASSATAAKPSVPIPRPPPAKTTVPAKTTSIPQPPRQWNEKLNPPEQTYAAPLTVPAQKSGQGKISYLYNAGKAYVNFYKTGIQNIRWTAKLARGVRERVANAQAASGPQSQSQSEKPGAGSILTRAEWQIIQRSRADMRRLPIMVVLLIVFGEWLPLLALWLTPVIPEPCRIPKQVHRSLSKLESTRRERERRLAMDAARLQLQNRKPGSSISRPGDVTGEKPLPVLEPKDAEEMGTYGLLRASSKLGTHSKIWDWLFVSPPKALLRFQLGRRLKYLREDDLLIKRDGGWQGLGEQELQRACVERGIDVLGKSEGELRSGAVQWFGVERR